MRGLANLGIVYGIVRGTVALRPCGGMEDSKRTIRKICTVRTITEEGVRALAEVNAN